jgi:hypothetical protein
VNPWDEGVALLIARHLAPGFASTDLLQSFAVHERNFGPADMSTVDFRPMTFAVSGPSVNDGP